MRRGPGVAAAALLLAVGALTLPSSKPHAAASEQRILSVSLQGSDSAPCSRAPCASFDRAYQAARPGDIVEVHGGTYPDQRLSLDASKTSADDVGVPAGSERDSRDR